MNAENVVSPTTAGSEVERFVMCIGVDDRQHVCLPESDICKCGMKIKRKKLLRNDSYKLGCYECTY